MFTQMPNFAEGGSDFLHKLWGGGFSGMAGGGMPNMTNFAAPPVDFEEADKRTRDLRAVENRLQLSASLLCTAIQGLEVQRATLVVLQTFDSALSPEAMKSAFDGLTPSASSSLSSSSSGKKSKPAWPHTAVIAKPDDEPPPEDEDEAKEDTDDDQAEAHAEAAHVQAQAVAQAQAAACVVVVVLDPSSWWNMLQQQFNQIASFAAAAIPVSQNLMPGFPGGFPGFGGAPGAEGLDAAPEDIEEPTAPAKPKRAAVKAMPKPAAKTSAGHTARPATKKTAAKKTPAKSVSRKPTNDTP